MSMPIVQHARRMNEKNGEKNDVFLGNEHIFSVFKVFVPLFSLTPQAQEKSSKKETPCPQGLCPAHPPPNLFEKRFGSKNFK